MIHFSSSFILLFLRKLIKPRNNNILKCILSFICLICTINVYFTISTIPWHDEWITIQQVKNLDSIFISCDVNYTFAKGARTIGENVYQDTYNVEIVAHQDKNIVTPQHSLEKDLFLGPNGEQKCEDWISNINSKCGKSLNIDSIPYLLFVNTETVGDTKIVQDTLSIEDTNIANNRIVGYSKDSNSDISEGVYYNQLQSIYANNTYKEYTHANKNVVSYSNWDLLFAPYDISQSFLHFKFGISGIHRLNVNVKGEGVINDFTCSVGGFVSTENGLSKAIGTNEGLDNNNWGEYLFYASYPFLQNTQSIRLFMVGMFTTLFFSLFVSNLFAFISKIVKNKINRQ